MPLMTWQLSKKRYPIAKKSYSQPQKSQKEVA
jgi:hypothetical protein